jgi:putative FmdB family regulatory protein
MPTYSYRCTSCDNAFDIQQAFTEDSLTTCPECGKALRKVFSAIGVTFQGSGFYRTDSRAESKKKSSDAASSPKKDSGASTPAATPAKKESSSTSSTTSTSS